MRRALLALAVGGFVAAGGGEALAADAPPTGRLLITVRPRAAAVADVERALGRAGARVAGPVVPQIGLVTVAAGPRTTSPLVAAALRALPGVIAVTAEHRAQLRRVPNDPALAVAEAAPGTPAGTPVEWWAAREGFPAAWDEPVPDGATVAVIDTGADAQHPELADRIAASIDLDATPGHGPATTDDVGHGTPVAALACATAGNGIGLAGAAPGCRLLIVKSDLSDASIAQGIVWATDHGADAINMSFGTDGSRPAPAAVVDAVDYALRRNVVMVAAAADDPVQEQGYPADVLQPADSAGDPAVAKGLTVTAAAFDDHRAPFAGSGPEISMAAYGTFGGGGGPKGIFSAFATNHTEMEAGSPLPTGDPPCGCRTTFQGDSRYAYIEGTSVAAPMVAGVAALVRRLNPDLSAPDVIRLLEQSAHRVSGTSWGDDLGWGILDAGAALAAARGVDRRPPVSHLEARRHVHGTRFTLRWTGFDTAPAGVVASGIARFEVWRSTNGRPPRRIATTTARQLVVRGRPGSRYTFFTVAIDRAGNREPRPGHPDATVRVARRA
jgi:subtilisin family serine protease